MIFEKSPSDFILSCQKYRKENISGIVVFDSCNSENQVENGTWKVPFDGIFSISFSGILQSDSGSRIWINLKMKNTKGEDCILASAFAGMEFKKGQNSVENLTTSPNILTLEKLEKDQEIWVSVGRRKYESGLSVDILQPANFNVKLIEKMK